MTNQSLWFFKRRFSAQAQERNYTLNPFEERTLPYLYGRVLDLGYGLGNLALTAARRGCIVHAVDGSPTTIENLNRIAERSRLPVTTGLADLSRYDLEEQYDCVVAIDLLMVFPRLLAAQWLENIRQAVHPGGTALVNVLIEGTTYLDMFEAGQYCLFGERELTETFDDWVTFHSRIDQFPAPGSTIKRISTVIAGKRPRGRELLHS